MMSWFVSDTPQRLELVPFDWVFNEIDGGMFTSAEHMAEVS